MSGHWVGLHPKSGDEIRCRLRVSSDRNYFEAIELSDEYSIVDMAVPSNWAGKTLEQLNIRSRYGISIIGIRGLEETNVNPPASYALHPQDVLIVLGHNTEIQKLREMTNYK